MESFSNINFYGILEFIRNSSWKHLFAALIIVALLFVIRPILNAALAKIQIAVIRGFVKFLIWFVITLLILDNLGIKVISLLTGLGIGGIAVALAVQKILGDLFASISITIDKPFEIDDLITIDSITGTVESIGVKSTKIRSITGEQVIISNSDLMESRINNFKRMKERRTNLALSISPLSFGTSQSPMAVVDIVKCIVDNQSDARFDRGHLKSFSAASFDYEFVYWVTKPDYLSFMNTQQSVNLNIIKTLADKNISLALPIQKVQLEKTPEK